MSKILFLGDICFAGYDERFLKNNTDYQEIKKHLSSYEGLVVGNLESPLTRKGKLNLNKISFRANPEILEFVHRVDVCSLSNNHISDSGHVGAKDTQKNLEKRGIKHVGYGDNIFKARRPLLVQGGEVSTGFLAYNCLTTNGENYATAEKPGVSPIAREYLREDVNKLKKEVDFVVVLLHWGVENAFYPTPDQIYLARKTIDYGADVIVGTHPHVVQGYEKWKGKLILYSLGNFMFPDIKYKLRTDENVVEEKLLKQKPVNRVGYGIEIGFNNKKIEDLKFHYVISNTNSIPEMKSRIPSNLSPKKLNKKLKKYAKTAPIGENDNLDIETRFNGRVYQHFYRQDTVNNARLSLLDKVKQKMHYG